MGLTAAGIAYSPPGQRPGAHINPAVTRAFVRLRKIAPWDAAFYMPAQLLGGVLGMLMSWAMNVIRAFYHCAHHREHRLGSALCGIATGLLVMLDVYFAAPLCGFSMNLARTASSALMANTWKSCWVYLCAPPLAMLAAAELDARLRGERVPALNSIIVRNLPAPSAALNLRPYR